MDLNEFFLPSFVNIVYTCSLFFPMDSPILLVINKMAYLFVKTIITTEQIFSKVFKHHRNE